MEAGIQHILWGLCGGLVVGFVFWFQKWLENRTLKREIRTLHEQLARDMKIRDKGNRTQQDELEGLRKDNENLRVTVKTLKSKPGRAELELLHIYDHALHSMQARAPGFAASWEIVLREAREEIARTETGMVALMRRVFRPSLGRSSRGQIADVSKSDHRGALGIPDSTDTR